MKFQTISYQLYTEMKKAKKLITDIKLHALDCREDVFNKHFMMLKIRNSLPSILIATQDQITEDIKRFLN